jgi:hypothetical protein
MDSVRRVCASLSCAAAFGLKGVSHETKPANCYCFLIDTVDPKFLPLPQLF